MRLGKLFLVLLSALANPLSATAEYNQGKIAIDHQKNFLFEQFAANTFSLQLLQNKNQFSPKTLVFGGVAEGDLQHWQGDNLLTTPPENYHVGTGFYFTQATLDVLANFNKWSAGFFSVSAMHIGQGGPDGNFVYYPHGFLLFGNLDQFPGYVTLGMNTIPFGVFTGSGVWDMPLTASYFNPDPALQLSLGFYKNNWNLSATVYHDNVNYQYHVVENLLYNNSYKDFNYGFGLGHINDLKTNTTGNPTNRTRRNQFIPPIDLGQVWDVNATLGYKLFTFTAEYLSGTSSVGGNTGDPQTYGVTFTYSPVIYGKTTNFGVSRSFSINFANVPTNLSGKDQTPMVAAGLKNAWGVGVSRTVYKDIITLGFDAERAVTYANQHTYTYTLDLLAYL